MWWSGEQGRTDIHEKVGYSIFCLVATRVIWGFVGSEGARFRSFVVGPNAVLRYLREGGQYAGHNPMGALSVLVLLSLLLVQSVLGMFSRDDLLFEGPFSYWAGSWSGTLTEWHKTNWLLLQGFIALHLTAVLWYQWRKRQPLLQAMWRGQAGYKSVIDSTKAALVGAAHANADGVGVMVADIYRARGAELLLSDIRDVPSHNRLAP